MTEWTDWTPHDGKGCPCVGMFVEYEAGNPHTNEIFSKRVLPCVTGKKGWLTSDYSILNCLVVFRYRIRKPDALQVMIERAEALPVVKHLEEVR